MSLAIAVTRQDKPNGYLPTAETSQHTPLGESQESRIMMQFSLEVVLSNKMRERFLSVLRTFMEPLQYEEGCIRSMVWRDAFDEGRLRFTVLWKTPEGLERYVRSNRFRSVLVAAELASERPSLEVRTISQTRGIEYIVESLREKPAPARENQKSPIGQRHLEGRTRP